MDKVGQWKVSSGGSRFHKRTRVVVGWIGRQAALREGRKKELVSSASSHKVTRLAVWPWVGSV